MAAGDNFVHLHNHSSFSILDGLSNLDALMEEAARMGQPAVAVTDHGHTMGVYEAYKAGQRNGVKAIAGSEVYTTPGTASRTEKKPILFGEGGDDDVSARGAYGHMTLWAENNTGLHNLFKVVSYASLDGQYKKPRIDRDLLSEFGTGLLGTTGCPSGEVQTRLRLGQYEEALQAAADYRDILGAGNYYLELMDHGLEIETRVRHDLLRIGKELGLPLVATNDLHYVRAEDAAAHDAMLCVQSGSKMADPGRFKFTGTDYYLKSAAQMREVFADLPDACDNTLLIAERCAISFDEGADLMPRFDVPDGETEESWLRKEVYAGLERRYPDGVPEDRRKQADYELDVIISMGFAGYFLVTADFIMWAKRQGIRVGPGRGSAAGAIIAYALGITELDPMEHGLLFERFLNPERVSMPDIDVDFDDTRRGEVIQYVTEKYGADHVAQLVTFGFVKAKAAIKDAARILDYPFAVGDSITKLVPDPIVGKDMPLRDVFDPEAPRFADAADLRAKYQGDPDTKKIVDTALGLEGVIRQTGVHAAGIIISKNPLTDSIPIMKREKDGAIITGFDQKTCETLGLLKMDFLGLRNLTIMDEAVRLIAHTRGEHVNLDTLPLTDPATYRLLARGDTLGVFQLDGGPMRALLKSMRPDGFEDISAVLALYRPGPMGANAHNDYADRKNGRKPVIPIHRELAEPLEDILGDTYGLIVYQEQVMAIAQKLAGYTLGEADLFRRAMGKKDAKVLQGEFGRFSSGMQERGYSMEAIRALWDILLPFSDYAFNKAHTAAYGLIAYQTAYLKANYPSEYMAALLTSVTGDKDKAAIYLNECRRMGIDLLPPDVNDSRETYTPVGDNGIRVGLGAIRNVGHNAVDAIITGRDSGPYTDFNDFLARVHLPAVNKRAIDSLIKAGAFDSLHPKQRAALSEVHAAAVDQYVKLKKNQADGQVDLFGDADDTNQQFAALVTIPDVPEWDQRTLLAFERDMLGQYVSDHPLNGKSASLTKHATAPIHEMFPPGRTPANMSTSTIAGVVSGITRKKTRKGDAYVIATLEDLTGAVDVTVFPTTYQQDPEAWTLDAALAVRVRPDVREDGSYTLLASSVKSITLLPDPDGYAPPEVNHAGSNEEDSAHVSPGSPPDLSTQYELLLLKVLESELRGPFVRAMKGVLRDHPGPTPVNLQVKKPDGTEIIFKVNDPVGVALTRELIETLRGLLGSTNVVLPQI